MAGDFRKKTKNNSQFHELFLYDSIQNYAVLLHFCIKTYVHCKCKKMLIYSSHRKASLWSTYLFYLFLFFFTVLSVRLACISNAVKSRILAHLSQKWGALTCWVIWGRSTRGNPRGGWMNIPRCILSLKKRHSWTLK